MSPSSTGSNALAASLKGARVLIVDDDRLQCEAVVAIVREWDVEAFAATTFPEALRLFKEASPDLVLLDVMMPQVDGYKLAGLFKRDTRFVPIIMLTALEDIESKRRGLTAGADEFLTKPVNGVELQIRISSMIRIKRLAEALETANRQLAELATVDPLTGVANRRLLEQRLTYEFARYKRYGRTLALAMIDIDHFKKVNDTYGHPVGDKVLTLVGQTLRSITRATDLVGRYGGEEFMVIAPETPSEHSKVLAERIRSIVSRRSGEPEAKALGLPPITVSVGVASSDLNPATQEDFVKRSDEALYRAKREGRDRVVIAQ
jgi:diguanylate cyclase (GGDEF)-like protein